MIFYSDKIINEIIDNSQLDEIVDKIDAFRRDIEMLFTYFTYPTIGLEYIQNLLQFKSNKVAFYCFDDVFDIRNCPSCMIYAKDSQFYYIMIICTQKRFRGAGYATMLLDGFIEQIQRKPVKIVLSSLDNVVSYYQKYGFEVVDCDLSAYPRLAQFEKQDDSKIYSVMELTVMEKN